MEDKFEKLSIQEKEHVSLVFIGHVDAGKSTLCGKILSVTGMIDQRTLEKYEADAAKQNRKSWYLSWALDLSPEEREKGITIECGRGGFETKTKKFTIIDAPGHRNFVPSMIGGAAQADVAVLVVSARRGEFETGFEKGGQTREHAELVATRGVKRVVVVINKMDDISVEWSEERFKEIVDKIQPFLARNCGFSKEDIQFIPIAGFHGTNIVDVDATACPWYKGVSLFTYLDTMPSLERNPNAPFMMPVFDRTKEKGTLVAGRIESGKVHVGDLLLIMPINRSVEVLSILDDDDEIETATSGDNIKLRLQGVEEEEVCSGFVVCSKTDPVKVSKRFEVFLLLKQVENIITTGYTAVMHLHTCTQEIMILGFVELKRRKNQTTNLPKKVKFVREGDAVIATIETAIPISAESYTDFPQLGRFTLRDKGKTVAYGRITKVLLE